MKIEKITLKGITKQLILREKLESTSRVIQVFGAIDAVQAESSSID